MRQHGCVLPFFPTLQSSALISSAKAHLQLQTLWLGKETLKGYHSLTVSQVHPQSQKTQPQVSSDSTFAFAKLTL